MLPPSMINTISTIIAPTTMYTSIPRVIAMYTIGAVYTPISTTTITTTIVKNYTVIHGECARIKYTSAASTTTTAPTTTKATMITAASNWVYPPLVYTKISTTIILRRGKMAKKMKERRQYTKEFKTEAVALAEKKEKPISQSLRIWV